MRCEISPLINVVSSRFIFTELFHIGVRPFGVSSMLAGFGTDGSPQLYLNDPAGTYSAWKVR